MSLALKIWWRDNWPFVLAVLAVLCSPLLLGGMLWSFAWMIEFTTHWPWPAHHFPTPS